MTDTNHPKSNSLVLGRIVEKRVLFIRGQRVMLDSDLADLYGVSTKRFNEAVRRNLNRFPEDFMFQLSGAEWELLRSQIATSNIGRGGRRYAPFVFTENGVAMLSSVLNSDQAIQVNIVIMRTFNRLRNALSGQSSILRRLDALEASVAGHGAEFRRVFQVIRELVTPEAKPRRKIGIGRND